MEPALTFNKPLDITPMPGSDRIVVLEAGQIVEQGRHDDLLVHGGRYAAMWARQSAEDSDPKPDVGEDEAASGDMGWVGFRTLPAG